MRFVASSEEWPAGWPVPTASFLDAAQSALEIIGPCRVQELPATGSRYFDVIRAGEYVVDFELLNDGHILTIEGEIADVLAIVRSYRAVVPPEIPLLFSDELGQTVVDLREDSVDEELIRVLRMD